MTCLRMPRREAWSIAPAIRCLTIEGGGYSTPGSGPFTHMNGAVNTVE